MRADAIGARWRSFAGKMAIHPSQIDIANEVFSPSAEEGVWAREVLDEPWPPPLKGQGAVRAQTGRMIDLVLSRSRARSSSGGAYRHQEIGR